MKYQIMIGMLFTLLAKRKVSAGELAAKYGVSKRSVYRYVDEMTVAGIPIDLSRGAQGGIYISDAYKLPRGLFTRDEYARTVDAMRVMNDALRDRDLTNAIEKLTSLMKREKFDTSLSGNILVDSGTWGDERRFADKLALIERATEERMALEIDYTDRGGERTRRTILPHLLVYKQNVWYVYAWCRTREAFRLFKIGRMRTVIGTEETFERIPFSRDDIPLSFWTDSEKQTEARFEISAEALPFAEEWLGVENIYRKEEKFYADVLLPDDESLPSKILSAGAGIRVLSPESLVGRIKKETERLARSYGI